jgi:hypothetical protein
VAVVGLMERGHGGEDALVISEVSIESVDAPLWLKVGERHL